MFAYGANDQLFDFGGGNTVELGGLVRLPLNEGCRDIVAIADALLDRIGGRHPVAAVVEDPTHQQRLRLLPNPGVVGPLLVALRGRPRLCIGPRQYRSGCAAKRRGIRGQTECPRWSARWTMVGPWS